MKEEILSNLNSPNALEKLYRDNRSEFKKAFDQLYPQTSDNLTMQIWHERLNFQQQEISWGTRKELITVAALALLAGVIAKLPDILSLEPDNFFARNIGFVLFTSLAIYFAWRQLLHRKKIIAIASLFLAAAVYINVLPIAPKSDSLLLAFLHLPFLLWAVVGFTFTGNDFGNYRKRIDFLRYNGDLVVMSTVILIAGAILSGITIGLFDLINVKIENFYFRYIAILGAAATPMVATFLVQTNPQLVKNVSPVIAKVFTPLVLVMLLFYLIAIFYTGKDPFNDRDFLIFFNLLLIGVMAIILFSVAETTGSEAGKTGILLLFLLSATTIVINGIALSAIVFRISEWGVTPNRIAVLGANLLVLSNLIMVTLSLFQSLRGVANLTNVENRIASFLPVYTAWTAVVAFLFPLLFGFK